MELKTKTCNFGEQNFSIAYVDILDDTKLCFIFDKLYYLINPQSNGGDLEIYKRKENNYEVYGVFGGKELTSASGEFQEVEEVEIYHKGGEIYECFLHDLKKMNEKLENFYDNDSIHYLVKSSKSAKYSYLAKLARQFDLD
jgi:hypothetical protein